MLLFPVAVGNDYSLIPGSLVFGELASPFNTLIGGEQCFNISTFNDSFKEDDEYFKLLLSSEDEQVCLCRDFALFTIIEDEKDGVLLKPAPPCLLKFCDFGKMRALKMFCIAR